ncbi:MAG: iron ABC transporter substrate-binding protein [Rhodobacteraceae bacterium]|nr:iron ABC transporter substrate-binding protein [Paracoccaceae bacterium]
MSGRGAERILLLIEWIATRDAPFTFTEVVEALALPKSSALASLRLLVDQGYLSQGTNRRYELIRLPGQPDAGGAGQGTLRRIARAILQDMVAEAGESGFLAVLGEGQTVRYLIKLLPSREIRYDRDVDVPRRPHQVSAGIALLTGFDDDALAAYAAAEHAAGRLTDTQALLDKVAAARASGAHVNPRGIVEGAAGISAPVRDAQGRVIAALNIAGPADRLAEHFDHVTAIVRRGAAALEEAIAMGQPTRPHSQDKTGEQTR